MAFKGPPGFMRGRTGLLTGEPPLLDTSVYHCQQAVEKGLKSFLTLNGVPFQKTHNLVALIDLCARIDPGFLRWIEAAKSLTPYATEFRYPGDVIEPESEEALRAVRDAREVLNFIAPKLPADV